MIKIPPSKIKRYRTIEYHKIPPIRDAFFEYTRSYDNWGTDYSVTQLLRPPREVMLTKRYKGEIDDRPLTHDMIMKALKAFRGTAIHNHLEFMIRLYIRNHPHKGYMLEKRLWDRINGRKISGKFDVFLNAALYDYKTTSVWKAVFNNWDDYVAQLNLYDYFLYIHDIKVNLLYIIVWYMDWVFEKQFQDPEYPKQDIELIKVESKWDRRVQQEFLHHRIDVMKENEDVPDDELTPCTDEEMWSKKDSYAVKRPGQDRAVATKGLDTRKKAEKYIRESKAKDKKDFYVEFRPGLRTKCMEFCDAAPYCNIFQKYKKTLEAKETTDA